MNTSDTPTRRMIVRQSRAKRPQLTPTCYARISTCYDIEIDLLCISASPDMHDNRRRSILPDNALKSLATE